MIIDYKAVKGTYDEIYAIGLVKEGAMERDFVHFNKEKQKKIELQTINEEKRIILGAVLVPDKKIYRNNEYGDEWNIIFEKEVIEEYSQQFFQDFNQKNITLGHEFSVEGVTVVQSWIKSSENDKSKDYGMNDPVGTWYVAMKIDSDVVWENVKQGIVNAYSIEGWVSMAETELKIAQPKKEAHLAKQEEKNNEETVEKDLTDEETIEEIKKLMK